MPLIDIRAALETDVPDIQSCARLAYSKYICRIGREPAPMHADFSSQVDKGYIEIATLESHFAGHVVFYPEDDHIHLESVAVLSAYSGCGIGKRLIKHVEHAAKEAGYAAVELDTNEAMTDNLAMYPKMGYIKLGSRREVGFCRVYFRKQL